MTKLLTSAEAKECAQAPAPQSSIFIFPSSIGTQLPPGFRRAFQIAVRGIRIRIGRSLVTLSGVILGIAFLMSTVTTQFIGRAVARERESRQQLQVMENVLRTQIGGVAEKIVAVVVAGTPSAAEAAFLDGVAAARPADLRVHRSVAADAPPAAFARGAVVLLLLGDAPRAPAPLAALTAGMPVPLVLDSRVERVAPVEADVRREVFFPPPSEIQLARQARRASGERFRLIWIVVISLAVTMIGVSNALLMSVTERFREIGTMKCLGALSVFIRRLFLIESALIGLTGSFLGVFAGALPTLMVYAVLYGFKAVFGGIAYGGLLLASLGAVVTGTLLAMLAALYPARCASQLVPAAALRSTV